MMNGVGAGSQVLVVDDDPGVLSLVRRALDQKGWGRTLVRDGYAALEETRSGRFGVVLLDLELPGMSGLEVLRELRRRTPEVAVVMLTGHGDVPTVVEALQLGAADYVTKPFDPHHLQQVVARTLEMAEVRRVNLSRAARGEDAHALEALGDSPAMRRVVDVVDRLSATSATILIQGATGTGKSWLAELIHSRSLRPRGPFVEVRCAALSPLHLDAELFGVEAKTAGGRGARRGLLESAHGGTLFLDEIGALAPEAQPKLLSVLESGRFRRVGGTREVEVDLRVLASTRHDLARLVTEGRIREDLYYRIAVHPVLLPSLRDRGREGGADLVYRLLAHLRRSFGRGPGRVSPEALDLLLRHPWPGNLHELRNVLERALLHDPDAPELLPHHLPAELRVPAGISAPPPTSARCRDLAGVVADAERRHIETVLAETRGNRAAAARALGISRAALYQKLNRYDLTR